MHSRYALTICTVLLAACFFAPQASFAVKIDPDLQAALANKGDDMIPVLMIYDNPHDVSDMVIELDRLSPSKRRKGVIEALKKKNRKSQTNAMFILQDPENRTEIADVTQLYLASAIAFRATGNIVETLGGLPDSATLFLDKSYDLDSDTQRGPAGAPHKAARADTVWSVKFINADKVWNQLGYTGEGVIVGHIDSGIDLDHPDLAHRLWINTGEIPGNGLDDDENGFIDDINGWDFGDNDNNPNDDGSGAGHGTHTAGTVAGDGTGGSQTGVAPGAKLIACKAFDNSGSGTLGMIWGAEQYCVENGARIITMSLGVKGDLSASLMRNERVNMNNLRDAGVTMFNSAGNEHYEFNPPIECGLTARVPAPWNSLPTTPSNLGGVIAVGGTGYQSNGMYNASSRGPAKWDNVDPFNDWPYSPGLGLVKPDISAPGTAVNSTTVGGGYSGDTWSGTSMACPHAAGLAALMLEKNPSLSPAGLDSIMELNALDLGTAGKDNSYGAGRIDAFDIVSATPTSMSADLVQTGILPDAENDGILDPGETSTIAFELKNVSTVIDAIGVTARLALVSNPYVTVTDSYGTFPDIAMNGGSEINTGDPFALEVAANAPQGYPLTMMLTVASGSFFERTYEIPWYVGLPDWRTHNVGNVYLTVTDQGIIGYMDQNGTTGDGMGYLDGNSGLFLGSFWAGTDVNYICNRDFSGVPGNMETFEWEVSESPNGRVADLGSAASDQTFKAIFTDSGHNSPKPLIVEQTSLAFSGYGENEFVILEYKMTNEGASDLNSLYNGVYCDFDINDSSANMGGTDATRNLTYMYSAGGPYFGIALIGPEGTAENLSLINNETYVYPNSAIGDGFKLRFLKAILSTPSTPTAEDWSAITSSQVNLSANGGTAVTTYALVYGETLAQLQDNVDAANSAYNPLSPISDNTPIKIFRLAQNHPNPFNPSTNIKFSVAGEGHVELGIYDLSGRLVRTLVSETRAAGEHSVSWDGRDASGGNVPSGMYFYKYASGGETTSRKMTLIK
ncbi:MAG: S8 family serine peptidase [bacterium]|nr:S8 family serine peptidase [bacterium]